MLWISLWKYLPFSLEKTFEGGFCNALFCLWICVWKYYFSLWVCLWNFSIFLTETALQCCFLLVKILFCKHIENAPVTNLYNVLTYQFLSVKNGTFLSVRVFKGIITLFNRLPIQRAFFYAFTAHFWNFLLHKAAFCCIMSAARRSYPFGEGCAVMFPSALVERSGCELAFTNRYEANGFRLLPSRKLALARRRSFLSEAIVRYG